MVVGVRNIFYYLVKNIDYFWVDLNINVEELYDFDGQNSFIEGIITYFIL